MPQPIAHTENSRNTDGRVARGEATRERVLDAAERCFASEGFEAVTIRQIARAAEVTLGVVSFHGGSKEDLFKTVLARRVTTLDNLRKAALAAVRARGDMTIRDVVDAYLTPYLDIASRGDPQWRAYAQLIARVASNDDYFPEVRELYDPTARIFIAELQRLRPGASAEELATVLTLTVASMLSIVASRARIAGLSDSDEIDQPISYRSKLIDFCTGGIEMVLPSD